MARYDAIVLGIGGVGSAALYHLAKRGSRVIGIDRFSPPHKYGSSHGQTRVIRQAYFEHPDYVPLLKEAYRLWYDLESRAKSQLFHQIGLIEVGPADGVVVSGVLRAAVEHQLSVQSLTAEQIERRWPGLQIDKEHAGVFEPAAGYLRVEQCVRAHLDAAKALGAEIVVDTEVKSWTANSDGILARTADGTEVSADRLIIAAGPWSGRLLNDLDVSLTVRRQALFWFSPVGSDYHVSTGMPVFLFDLPHGIFYGFPQIDERGVKFAEHTSGREIDDPLNVNRDIDPEEQSRLTAVLKTHLPGVSSRVGDHSVCLYTMSPDEHFVVDRHPEHGNVTFAAGLSGHGFKFTPVLGRALADLALDGGTDLPIEFLSVKRFGSSQPRILN